MEKQCSFLQALTVRPFDWTSNMNYFIYMSTRCVTPFEYGYIQYWRTFLVKQSIWVSRRSKTNFSQRSESHESLWSGFDEISSLSDSLDRLGAFEHGAQDGSGSRGKRKVKRWRERERDKEKKKGGVPTARPHVVCCRRAWKMPRTNDAERAFD